MPGTLSVVATPIGNLGDITKRAVETLTSADIVVCEDTRVGGKLLHHLGIKKPLLSVHERSADRRLSAVVGELKQGKDVAFISDAGTPNVNDPGGKLTAAAFAAGIRVVPIPGVSAITAAISVCGFPMDEFAYLGFSPHKKGRETFFRDVADRKSASVFLESTHRIDKALTSLQNTLDPRRLVCVCRELTKQYESIVRGTIDDVTKRVRSGSLKGEFVIVIASANFYET